jgi:tRNA (guanine37-N1)-methyltransferase
MKFQVITLMPDLLQTTLGFGVVGRAFEKGLCQLNLVNPRQFSENKHQTVDDRPFGGGDGMLMMADPLQKALDSFSSLGRPIYLSPQGPLLDDQRARQLAQESCVTLICGRYGGVDQRFLQHNNIEEISIGNYILSGGELAAAVLIDSVSRHIPGVLGHVDSANADSFATGLLETPHFTRPRQWQGLDVPPILLSGDHEKVEEYQKIMGLVMTLLKRPDLLKDKRVDWIQCSQYLTQSNPLDLQFLPVSLNELLDLIKEKANETPLHSTCSPSRS